MKKETFLLFVLLFVNTCWTAPNRPASLEVAGPADLRKSQQTVTEKSMVYWLVVGGGGGGLTCVKQKSRRDTQPCRANSRQHMAATTLPKEVKEATTPRENGSQDGSSETRKPVAGVGGRHPGSS